MVGRVGSDAALFVVLLFVVSLDLGLRSIEESDIYLVQVKICADVHKSQKSHRGNSFPSLLVVVLSVTCCFMLLEVVGSIRDGES